MKKVLILAFLCYSYIGFTQTTDNAEQIAGALAPAPESQRSGAMIYGFSSDGKLIVLRKGTNELICLADDPNKKGFNAACYHKDLEPFMARSRELRSQGKNNGEIFQIKEEEVKSGKLKMPDTPTTLHIAFGPDAKYNAATSEIENINYRYVVYIPFATQESTGLPLKPVVNGGPWLMDPGTHRAHIMISTPKN